MNIYAKLMHIQHELKAPKNCFNSFGNYKYRNAEGILEALKPVMFKYKCVLRMTDEIEEKGGKLFVKAIAELIDAEVENPSPDTIFAIGSQGWAEIPAQKKGLDQAQLTGSTSSFARKYCLNALFCIDDTKDSDGLPPDEERAAEPEKPVEHWRLIENDVQIRGTDGRFYSITKMTKPQLEKAIKMKEYNAIKDLIQEVINTK